MRNFVRKVHTAGFKTNLWWYPLGVSPESRLAKEHPELLVQSETGVYPQDERKLYQLCPAYEPARQHIASLLRKFILDYDYDGVYVDTVGLSAVPPCFNPAHHHRSPLDSFQAMPLIYKLIRDELRKMKPDPYYEVCICSMPHSPYYMPYYDIANASDPVNVFQMRRRIKVEKAIRGPRFCVGDCYQVPIDQWKGSSVPESFESAMGTGAQMTTFYSHLSATQLAKWRHWFRLYNELQLSSAEFLNLYDIAFDKPEAYVVRKGKQMFYGFFADYWPVSRPIPLRGLDPKTTYELVDYANDRPLGKVIGGTATLKIGFKDSLLVVATPAP
jgi:alpha-galactosidase